MRSDSHRVPEPEGKTQGVEAMTEDAGQSQHNQQLGEQANDAPQISYPFEEHHPAQAG
jgi:hypothetical protein